MQQGGWFARRSLAAPGASAVAAALFGKLVLEVLPAALASVIGGFLFAHYQFGQPGGAEPPERGGSGGPASAEMVQLVREEHAMIQRLPRWRSRRRRRAASRPPMRPMRAQRPMPRWRKRRRRRAAVARLPKPSGVPAHASRGRVAAAIAACACGGAAGRSPRRSGRARRRPPVDASAGPARRARRIARSSHDARRPGPRVSVTLHAVVAIGGIPSWIGHRFGDDDARSRPRRTSAPPNGALSRYSETGVPMKSRLPSSTPHWRRMS